MGQPAHGGLRERPPGGRLFWAALAAGWALMAYGMAGAVANTRDTDPANLARWFLGAAVAHDAVLAPATCLAGAVLSRLVPARFRAPVQAGLIVAGVVTLFAFPLVRAYGLRPDNPTVVFRHYGPSLALVLAGVGLVTAGLAVWAAKARRP
jgi:hypothetical protein